MSAIAEPRVYLWTRDEYQQLIALGIFDRKRIELIEGQVIEMSPMGSLHATTVALVAQALTNAVGNDHFVRWQMPFAVGERSEPEPDIALVTGHIRDYSSTHPTTAALLVEVADTSLAYDREQKSSLYAMAGVGDYWIINLVDRQIEVYRNPQAHAAALYGYQYANIVVVRDNGLLMPLALPEIVLHARDLLP